MAAVVVCPSAEDWPIIQRFLSDCEDGAIIVPPAVKAALDEKFKSQLTAKGLASVEHLGIVDYDFGGQADMLVDEIVESAALLVLADDNINWRDDFDAPMQLTTIVREILGISADYDEDVPDPTGG